MTTITAAMVKELREKTGAGMMDCKAALKSAGDMDGAIKFLREKGLSRAAKKSGRIAAEGLIGIVADNNKAAMVEVNSETDFVARNDEFKELVKELGKTALSFDASSVANPHEIDGSALNEMQTSAQKTVAALITDKVATIGEKIALRRFCLLSEGNVFGSYLHGAGSIGVVVGLNLSDASAANKEEIKQAARDVAMHVAAFSPQFISQDQIPQSWIDNEKEIFTAQMRSSGKPEAMIEKIVAGKLAKHKKEFCLLDQPFVKNPDQSIQQMLDEVKKNTGVKVSVAAMARFKVGEGIDKKEDDFAKEVEKMASA